MFRAPMLEQEKEKWTGWNQPTPLITEVKISTQMPSPQEKLETLVVSVEENNQLGWESFTPQDKSLTIRKCAEFWESPKDWLERVSAFKVSVTSDTGLQSFSLRLEPSLSVLLNGMAASGTKTESILMNFWSTRKEINTKLSKDIQELRLSLMILPFTSQLISSSQLPWKRLSTKTTPINSKPNLLSKLPMDPQLWKENKFWEREEFNFYPISYVMQVVSQSAILNGWKT